MLRGDITPSRFFKGETIAALAIDQRMPILPPLDSLNLVEEDDVVASVKFFVPSTMENPQGIGN